MGRRLHRAVVGAALVTMIMLVVVSAAAARSVTNTYDKGTTTRTIWDTSQVACYKIPEGIDHTGYIYMDLKFKPNWADFDVYLLNTDAEAIGGIAGEMGWLASFSGHEIVAFNVEEIWNTTPVPYGGITGDTYYVLVVAFNDTAKFQINGFYPQLADPEKDTNTVDAYNYYLERFRWPTDPKKWVTLNGPIYGSPYDFKPTSVGKVEARLEWPADVGKKTVLYTKADFDAYMQPANMEQYMYYGADWDTVWENYGDTNWRPPSQASGTWFGLLNPSPKQAQGTSETGFLPGKLWHYVPSLYMVALDPKEGPYGGPRLGKSTMGFKATLIYPENLRISSAPKKVKKGKSATVKGTFALEGAWVNGQTVVLQRKPTSGGSWKSMSLSTTTNSSGQWQIKFKPNKSYKYRAMGQGIDASGLAVEYSEYRTIKVVM